MLETDRLLLRPPVEADRPVFVDFFGRDDFMAYSGGTLSTASADARFDLMVETARQVPFAKQPVIERSSGRTLGYSGVARFEFEGVQRLEFGYRLIPEARGLGYGTEAGHALLRLAADSFEGELLAMIDPTNIPSQRVAEKLGFHFWKMATVDGYLVQIHRIQVGTA